MPNFSLILLPGKCGPDFQKKDLYNRVYSAWKEIWKKEFTDVGSPGAWQADHFLRQDCIPVILTDTGEIVSFFLLSFYSMNHLAARDCSYLSIFPSEAMQILDSKNVKEVMTLEFLTVTPEWRNKRAGIPMAGLIMSSALKVFEARGSDAALGVARIDYGVNKLCMSMGAESIYKEARRGNLVCELISFFKGQVVPYKDPKVGELVHDLWSKVENWSYELNLDTKKIAA